MEERTGKKPREAVGWKWQRQRERQKDNRQGKRGEEREKGGVTSQTSNIWMISLWNVSTHFGFSFVFRKKRKRRRNPTGWGETSSSVMASCLTHTHTHTLCSSFVPLFNLLYYHVPVSKQANILKSNEPCFHCVSVKHSSSSSSSSSSDSSSSSSSDSEDEVSHFRPQTVMLDQP